MPEKKIQDCTVAELEKRLKAHQLAVLMMSIAITMMVLSSIYQLFNGKFSVMVVLPVCFLPLLIINIKNVKQIKKELAQRNEQP
jgi:hypothetical protein